MEEDTAPGPLAPHSGERGTGSATESVEDPSTASGSPSLAFLRDLARAPDHPPNAFDLQIARRVGTAGGWAGAAPIASGRFVARRRLGAGGFGIVYEAFDQERNATVALKALRRRDPRAVSRFKREFRSFVELCHDNLVQLYELHAEEDAWFFTMELVRGTDLLTFVRAAPAEGGSLVAGPPPFDEERLRAAFRQLARGLSFLHGAGKLHRDVKPSNVMVRDDGVVKVLDFGLVADLADLPVGEGVLGTPAYMAPEQAAGLPAGTAADWYAVGVMLYEALTGRLPFAPGERPAGPPPPPGALCAGVPGDLGRLCLELLSRAPETRPRGHDVYEQLSAGRGGPRRVRAERRAPPFVGRAPQLGALREALAAAARGGAVVAFVHGPSGVGKSALVQRFADELRAREPACLALSGRCFEQESVPYKAVDGLVDDLCRRLEACSPAELTAVLPPDLPMLARLFPQLRELPGASGAPRVAAEEPGLRQRAFAAFGQLLRGRAGSCPALLIDDLQWGDLDSVALLVAILHAAAEEPAPLLLVASYRSEEAEANPVLQALSAELRELEGRVEVRRIELGELDPLESEALARSLLEADGRSGDALAETTLRAASASARGNPFLLTELLWNARGTGRSADTLDSRSDSDGALAQDPGALLAARIGRLPEPARRLLEVVAVAGRPIARELAARAAYGGEPESRELAALGLLRAGHLVRSMRARGREEILPYHDRIREVVTAALAPDAARERHHRLALALEASGAGELEWLLFHFRGAGRPEDAARYAQRAAAAAHEALAFDRAARLYQEAIELGAPPPEARALRSRLGDALAGAGRPREAALAYLAAAKGVTPAEALPQRRRAVEHLLGAGYLDEGLAALHEVLREVGIEPPKSPVGFLLSLAARRARLLARGLGFRERPERAVGERALVRIDACAAAATGLMIVNPILAAESQARHLLLALEAGEPYRAGRALAFEGVLSAIRRGRPHPSTDRILSAMRAIEERMDHPHLTGLARLADGVAAWLSGQWRRAHDLLAESESILRGRCSGVWWELDVGRLYRAMSLWMLGEVRELSRLVPALVDEARERGNRHVETAMQLFGGPICALAADRPAAAHEALAAAVVRWPRRPGSILHFREIAARARIALYEGRGFGARTVIDDARPALLRSGLLVSAPIRAELHLLRALSALATGDGARAAKDARALARSAVSWAATSSLVIQGGLAHRGGDLHGALALLARAEGRARENGVALMAAVLQRRRGEWIGGDEGRALGGASDAFMAGQGVAGPERMTAMLLGEA